MEIAQLEVSTQRHIDRMQKTAKVNYIQYGKGSKKGKAKSSGRGSTSGGSGGSSGKPSISSGKGKKVHYPQTFVGDVVKADIRRDNPVNQWRQSAGTVP